jgi:predicted acyl esterase
MRARLSLAAAIAALAFPATAAAAGPTPFGKLSCVAQEGVRYCPGSVATRVPTFDGVPLDVNVALPADQSTNLPLAVLSHGYGGHKLGFADMKPFAQRGYAVLTISARGFGDSCGSPSSRLADPVGCAKGWIHLDDTRYEVRDVQTLAGILADEGIADPQRVGAFGGSYGGGVSLALAALKDRIMLPDGSYAPWTSPGGKPMRLAGAAPYIPWSNLVSALMPNGHALDYTVVDPQTDLQPTGVDKQSFVAGLFASGEASGYYAPPGVDPGADLTTWFARVNAGEPYDGDPTVDAIKDELYRHHSAYAIDDSEAPAPTFIANGWTDDLFPVDEALRFYNRTRARHPGTPIALMALDFGHQRGQNKAADTARFMQHVYDWFDRYVKGDPRVATLQGVEALTETCPAGAPSGGPFDASSWVALHPGEVRGRFATPQTVVSAGGDPSISRTVDPIAGDGACAQTASADEAGTANFRLPAATGTGYTLLGSPTVVANLTTVGAFPELATRLWDVAPDGQQTLVARGTYRPVLDGRQVFQLHPGGWQFAAGHVAKLQLLGRDVPYARASNGTFTITVSDLELRLPVHERPSKRGQVLAPAAPVLPAGSQPAPGVRTKKAARRR